MFNIIIKDLKLFGFHGVLESEKKYGQEFIFNISIETEDTDFKLGDDLCRTVNYSEIINLIKEINASNKFNLLETLCQVITEKIILKSSLIKKVNLKIEKSSPPIKERLGSVGVEYSFERQQDEDTRYKPDTEYEKNKKSSKEVKKIVKTEKVYLSLGSNIGEKTHNLSEAVNKIGKNQFLQIKKISSVYKTEPMYVRNQDEFLNIVLEAEVNEKLNPFELLGFLKGIEYEMGRKNTPVRYGPRVIDIDIIFYGERIIKSDFLTIPHPGLKERNFVLLPLAEISPGIRLNGLTITQFIKQKKLKDKILKTDNVIKY